MNKIIFLDVDTQYDFMHKNGRFYVAGAESIILNLKKITDFAKKNMVRVVASKDNCIRNNSCANPKTLQGQSIRLFNSYHKIPETMMTNFFNVPNKKLSETKAIQIKEKNRLLIEKEGHSIFSNPNLKSIVKGTEKAYVYGVATDYCVKAAVLGLRDMGIKTYVVKDAIKPVFKKNEKKDLALFKKKGAKFLTTKQLLKKKF